MSTPQERAAERRAALIAGLRDAATFLETHPDVPMPCDSCMNVFLNTREEMADVARQGSWDKEYMDAYFILRKNFGEDLRLEINTARETVCRKVVKGTLTLPAQPERIVEDVEWVCDEPLLASK